MRVHMGVGVGCSMFETQPMAKASVIDRTAKIFITMSLSLLNCDWLLREYIRIRVKRLTRNQPPAPT